MQTEKTKFRVFVERPGRWKAQAEISGKVPHDFVQSHRRPLANPFFNILGRLAIALMLSLFQGNRLPEQTIILAILPAIQIEVKGERKDK